MRSLFFMLLLSSVFVSCRFMSGERVRGDGNITTREKMVDRFHSVDVSGDVVLRIRQAQDRGVRIETDENLLEFLEVFTEGHTLVIRSRKGYHLDPTKDIIAYVSAPGFREIDASGRCEIIGESRITGNEPLRIGISGEGKVNLEVDLPKLTTDISGTGLLNIRGRAMDFVSDVSGSSTIQCMDLVTENTSLDISGSSDAEVTVNKQLNVDASGASRVHYRGNASVNQNTSGASTVKKVG